MEGTGGAQLRYLHRIKHDAQGILVLFHDIGANILFLQGRKGEGGSELWRSSARAGWMDRDG